jgi:hypothetical protein
MPAVGEPLLCRWNAEWYSAQILVMDTVKRTVRATFHGYDASWDQDYSFDDTAVRWFHNRGKKAQPSPVAEQRAARAAPIPAAARKSSRAAKKTKSGWRISAYAAAAAADERVKKIGTGRPPAFPLGQRVYGADSAHPKAAGVIVEWLWRNSWCAVFAHLSPSTPPVRERGIRTSRSPHASPPVCPRLASPPCSPPHQVQSGARVR